MEWIELLVLGVRKDRGAVGKGGDILENEHKVREVRKNSRSKSKKEFEE